MFTSLPRASGRVWPPSAEGTKGSRAGDWEIAPFLGTVHLQSDPRLSPPGGGGTLAFEQERYPPQCTGAQAHNETRSRANKGQSLGVATLLWSAPAELDSATCVGPSHCIG